jgi:gamma-glutamyltranspeptidase/glutathione hydrolase
MIGFNTGTSERRAWQQRFPTYAEHGLVGAAHPLTVETGVAILRDGGNAVDAIVGAGLTAAVVMPEMCGLGGDLFAVLHHPTLGTFSLQGSGISPRNSSIEQMRAAGEGGKYMPDRGPLAISVPGMVDAYFGLLERFGTKSFADVAQYAIAHARNGFLVHDLGAQHIADYADMLANDEAAAAVFLPGGIPVGAGERLVQADLARTIESLGTDGRDSFYSGDIAQRITSYLQAHGGALSVDDFSEHSSDIGAPIETTYRGHTVYQTAIPSQGLILLEALNLVENGRYSPDHRGQVTRLRRSTRPHRRREHPRFAAREIALERLGKTSFRRNRPRQGCNQGQWQFAQRRRHHLHQRDRWLRTHGLDDPVSVERVRQRRHRWRYRRCAE